jgi:hypothetical protein
MKKLFSVTQCNRQRKREGKLIHEKAGSQQSENIVRQSAYPTPHPILQLVSSPTVLPTTE